MNDERKLDPIYLEINPQVIKIANVMITNAPSNQNGIERIAAASALDSLDLDVIYNRTDWTDGVPSEKAATADPCSRSQRRPSRER